MLLTRYKSITPLSKDFDIYDGHIVKNASAHMTQGIATRVSCNFRNLNDMLNSLTEYNATGYGLHDKEKFGKKVNIVTAVEADPPNSVARTKKFFAYRSTPGIVMIDHDSHPSYPSVKSMQLIQILTDISPQLGNAAYLLRGSVSSGVHLKNQAPHNPKSFHIYFAVRDATDIPRFGAVLFKRLWLNGHGFVALAGNGAMLERTLIDAAVFSSERLDFTGKPVIRSDELILSLPKYKYKDGGYLDTSLLDIIGNLSLSSLPCVVEESTC